MLPNLKYAYKFVHRERRIADRDKFFHRMHCFTILFRPLYRKSGVRGEAVSSGLRKSRFKWNLRSLTSSVNLQCIETTARPDCVGELLQRVSLFILLFFSLQCLNLMVRIAFFFLVIVTMIFIVVRISIELFYLFFFLSSRPYRRERANAHAGPRFQPRAKARYTPLRE